MPKQAKISYEPEADVLRWEISQTAPIDSAREMGNVIVHFTKQHVPVLIEILEASSFVAKAEQALSQTRGKAVKLAST